MSAVIRDEGTVTVNENKNRREKREKFKEIMNNDHEIEIHQNMMMLTIR